MNVQKFLKNGEMKDNDNVRGVDSVLDDVLLAIKEIRYGSVQVHIQDGKVVQIDKVNKMRIK